MNLPHEISSLHELVLQLQDEVSQLREENEKLQAENKGLRGENSGLHSELEKLKSQVAKNSRNSNKPPSSDGLKKPARKPAFPRKGGKKSGGQPGHKGKTLELSGSPDYTEPLLPDKCACGTPLKKEEAVLVEVRQVFDIPPPKLEITEYQKLGCTCGKCGVYNVGEFPDGVNARVQYGTGVRALVVLLNIAFKLPLKKIQTLMADLYGYAVNESTIIGATVKCFDNLENSERAIKQGILQSMVAHFDETGIRVFGKLHWLHAACTNLFTYLFVHAKRGKKAMQDIDSVLPEFKNWAVHDCWSSYFKFTNCLHAICGAHILRELTALQEKNIRWAVLFKTYLLALYHLSNKGTTKLKPKEKKRALQLFDEIWNFANKQEPPPIKSVGKRGRPKATKGRNLLTRLKDHQTALLAFAFNEVVPFTNNQGERDLRPAKTKQKVAGCFRTVKGAKIYARILGFISTARKHQFSVFNELKLAFSDKTSFEEKLNS